MPNTRNTIELLTISMDKMSKLMTRLSGINLFMKKMEMEDEGYVPVGLDMGNQASGFDEGDNSKNYFFKVDCWRKGLLQGLFRTFEDFEFRAAFTDRCRDVKKKWSKVCCHFGRVQVRAI
jgi:hypothetical protein